WGCILAAYFFTSFLMYVFNRLSPYSYKKDQEENKDDEEKRDFTLKECLWFCMTSLTPQGQVVSTRKIPYDVFWRYQYKFYKKMKFSIRIMLIINHYKTTGDATVIATLC